MHRVQLIRDFEKDIRYHSSSVSFVCECESSTCTCFALYDCVLDIPYECVNLCAFDMFEIEVNDG